MEKVSAQTGQNWKQALTSAGPPGMGKVVPPAAHAPLWRTLGRQTRLVAETCPLFSPLFATWLLSRLGPHSGVMESWKKLGRVRTTVGETRLVVGPEEG